MADEAAQSNGLCYNGGNLRYNNIETRLTSKSDFRSSNWISQWTDNNSVCCSWQKI